MKNIAYSVTVQELLDVMQSLTGRYTHVDIFVENNRVKIRPAIHPPEDDVDTSLSKDVTDLM